MSESAAPHETAASKSAEVGRASVLLPSGKSPSRPRHSLLRAWWSRASPTPCRWSPAPSTTQHERPRFARVVRGRYQVRLQRLLVERGDDDRVSAGGVTRLG